LHTLVAIRYNYISEDIFQTDYIQKDEELIYRGHVVSLDTPKESMAVRGSALIFPDATARRFWRDHKINYTVEVMPKNPSSENKGTSSKTTSSEEVRI